LQKAKHIEIKTAAGQRAAFLSPRAKADGLKDCFLDCRLNGESTLEFLLPVESEKIAELTPECQIWAGGRVYTLLKDEAVDIVRDKKNALWAKFMAVERWAELDSEYPEPYITNDPLIPIPSDLAVIIVGGGSDLSEGLYTVGSAAHALYAALQGSGWTMGTCDVPGIHDLEMEKVSRLQLIKEIQNIWGGYLVWDSANKIVHLRDANTWQNYTGFQIRYKKNLEHITRTQSNRLVTKLYAFGHDDLDIASVNGGVKYIVNHSYTSRDYIGIYKNQDIYYADELLEKATAELALICRPRYLYKTKMVDLRTLPEYSHENFTEGDMADVIDPDVAPESPRIRIIRHKYNLFQPWKCEVEIGDPQERLIEKLKASFNTSGFVDGKFNGNGEISGYSIENLTITNAKISNLSADKIIANTLMANVNLIIGSGNNVFKANYLGIFLGHADFALAPFSVDMYGNLYAQSATIQGTITSSTITGGIIRTAASGKRIEISNNQLASYNASNQKEGFSIEDYGAYGIFCSLLYRSGSRIGGLVVDDGLTLYSAWNALAPQPLYIKSGGNMYIDTIDPAGIIYIGKDYAAQVDFSGTDVIGLSNYALAVHSHSEYVKTMSSQNLRMQSFQGATNYVEIWLGTTYLGKVDLV
jgi:hypothetical protein